MATELKLPTIYPPAIEKYLPKVICGWCNTLMRDGILPASHGMCADCAVRFEEGRLRDVTKETT